MKTLMRILSPKIVGPFIGGLYRLWCRTLRYTQVGRAPCDELSRQGKLMVFCLWHGEVFAFPFKRGDWRIFAFVSQSRDGEYSASVMKSQGIFPLRGSSSRGGLAALLRGAKLMRDEKMHTCITPDGPRGPIHEVKDGVFYLAHRADAYIVPMRAFYDSAKIFNKSWDKFILPYPGSKVTMVFGRPYRLEVENLDEETLARERQKLKEKLELLTIEGDAPL